MGNCEKAQELVGRAWQAECDRERARLMRAAYVLDPANTDAMVWRAEGFVGEFTEGAIEMLEDAVEIAARRLGPEVFLSWHGRLGDLPEAGPYLRARAALARALLFPLNEDCGCESVEECLKLDPRDPEALRYDLLVAHLHRQRPTAARALMARFPEERSAFFCWARVLERMQSGQNAEAQLVLRAAQAFAPGVAPHFADDADMPNDLPMHYRPGCKHEEAMVAILLESAWRATPGGREWLRRHGLR